MSSGRLFEMQQRNRLLQFSLLVGLLDDYKNGLVLFDSRYTELPSTPRGQREACVATSGPGHSTKELVLCHVVAATQNAHERQLTVPELDKCWYVDAVVFSNQIGHAKPQSSQGQEGLKKENADVLEKLWQECSRIY